MSDASSHQKKKKEKREEKKHKTHYKGLALYLVERENLKAQLSITEE